MRMLIVVYHKTPMYAFMHSLSKNVNECHEKSRKDFGTAKN
jgi:hypothetical protein